MKKPSNGWGRIRGHEAPKPYPTHHGRGGEETGRRSAGAVSSPRARGAQSQLPRPTGREKPYHLLSRVGRLRSRHPLSRQRTRPKLHARHRHAGLTWQQITMGMCSFTELPPRSRFSF